MSYNDNKRRQIFVLSFILASLLGQLAGRWVRDYKSNHPSDNAAIQTEITTLDANIKIFEPGEHVISVPYEEPVKKSIFENFEPAELPYHPGYMVVGVSEKTILYVNNETVICTSTVLDNENNYVYNTFGIPEEYEQREETGTETKIYNPGEHVILKPINDPSKDPQQYSIVEGYEIIDISASNNDVFYQGGFVIYRNTETVECTKGTNGYNNFGKVVDTKTLVLKNQ